MHPPFSFSAAWDHALALVARIAALFGDPVDVRDQGEMRRSEIRALIAWLRPLEDFVRRLLIIRACREMAAHTRPRPAQRGARHAVRTPRTRARFRILPPAEHGRRPQRRGQRRRTHPSDLLLSAPLARRYNALVTVLAAPDRIVARLAQRLARDAQRIRAFLATRSARGDAVIADTEDASETTFERAFPPPALNSS